MTTKNIETTKELIDVRDYLGYDSSDSMARYFWREDKLNQLLETLNSMSNKIDSIDKRTREIMDRELVPIETSEIDALFHESVPVGDDMAWIDKIA